VNAKELITEETPLFGEKCIGTMPKSEDKIELETVIGQLIENLQKKKKEKPCGVTSHDTP